jgi:glycosyltransferase involved in cell wall biosynthesis
MRVAFDGTTLRPGRTGVGYYTEHLLRQVVEQGRGDQVTVVSNRAVDTTRRLPPSVRVEVSRGWLPRLLWMQTEAPRVLRRLGADVAHFTNGMVPIASPVPTVVTIHDMSLTLYPRYHPARRVLLNRPLVDLAARRADVIITVSHSAKHDIVRLYGLPSDRVHVVHEAAAPSFRPVRDGAALARVRRRYALADRFILYVGTIEPRKNLATLLDAFVARRADLPHQLVCAGPHGWLSEDIDGRLAPLYAEGAVRLTGYVPFDDLPALYTLAEMLVFPSLYEGFGLPVVEAMACGTPVMTGQVPALVEVTGEAAVHADCRDVEALGEAIVALARSRARRDHLARLGPVRAAAFSWERAARETLDVYRLAAGRPAGTPASGGPGSAAEAGAACACESGSLVEGLEALEGTSGRR